MKRRKATSNGSFSRSFTEGIQISPQSLEQIKIVETAKKPKRDSLAGPWPRFKWRVPGRRAANGALRVRTDSGAAETHGAGVALQQASSQSIFYVLYDFQRLGGRDAADDPGEWGEYAGIGAVFVMTVRFGVEAAVARGGIAVGAKDANLALHPAGGAGSEGGARRAAGGVELESSGEVVAAIHHRVRATDFILQFVALQPLRQRE